MKFPEIKLPNFLRRKGKVNVTQLDPTELRGLNPDMLKKAKKIEVTLPKDRFEKSK